MITVTQIKKEAEAIVKALEANKKPKAAEIAKTALNDLIIRIYDAEMAASKVNTGFGI